MVVVPLWESRGVGGPQTLGGVRLVLDLGLTRSLVLVFLLGCAINATRLPSEKRVCPGLGLCLINQHHQP